MCSEILMRRPVSGFDSAERYLLTPQPYQVGARGADARDLWLSRTSS